MKWLPTLNLTLGPNARWCTPWGVFSPILNFCTVALVYSLVEDLGETVSDDAASSVASMVPVWNEFSLAMGAVFVLVTLGPLFLYKHAWFLRPASQPPLRRRLRFALSGLTAGFVFKGLFFLVIWWFVDDQLGRNGMDSALWGELFYVGTGLFAMCLIFPLWEEWLFRILIFGWLRKRLDAWPAIVLMSALFSLAHGLEWQSISSAVLGLVTGVMYERTRSFAFCVAMHGGSNLAVVTLRLLIHRHGVFS